MSSSEILIALITQTQRVKELEEQLETINSGKSPCGHWAAHAMTNDGGKKIWCLECRLERAAKRLMLAAAIPPLEEHRRIIAGWAEEARDGQPRT